MAKKTILILSYSNIGADPRILRQIAALKENYSIVTVGNSSVNDSSIIHYPIYTVPSFSLNRKLKRFFELITGKFDQYYWDSGKKNLTSLLQQNNYDVVIANDILTLPLALAVANNKAKVLFDAHDFHPQEFEENFKWRMLHQPLIKYLCKKYIPLANSFITASDGFVEVFEKYTGCKPQVITNAPFYSELLPSKTDINHIKLVHHGAAIPSRKLELLIEMMGFLDEKYTLDFILVGNVSYIKKLKQIASKNKKIRFLQPVKTTEIPSFLNSYDIGVYIMSLSNFNNLVALPNKLFEFVQARIMSVVSPNQEMAKFVKKYDTGVVIKDYSPKSMAEAIKNLSVDRIMYFKKQSGLHAMELSADANMKKIRELISELVYK